MGFIQIIDPDESFTKKFGDSEIFCRRITGQIIHELNKKHSHEETLANRQKIIVQSLDEQNDVNNDILDYIITGWKNIKHPKTGDDVPCTRSAKLLLPGSVKNPILEDAGAESISKGEPKNAPEPEAGK